MAGTSTKYGPSSIISATLNSADLASGFPVGMVSITVRKEENFISQKAISLFSGSSILRCKANSAWSYSSCRCPMASYRLCRRLAG